MRGDRSKPRGRYGNANYHGEEVWDMPRQAYHKRIRRQRREAIAEQLERVWVDEVAHWSARPLEVDDEWIDDGGELNRCERIYGDTILLSWESRVARGGRVYEKHLTAFAVGQRRQDGSIIGPPNKPEDQL